MKFFSFFFATMLVLLIVLLTIYFWGMGQIHPRYESLFFQKHPPWVIIPRHLMKRGSPFLDDIIWLDVYRNSGGTLVVDRAEGGPALFQILDELEGQRVILNIESNVEDIDRQLTQGLPAFLRKTPFLLQSRYDVILRATKEAFADVPYGSSQSDWLRMNSFSGMAPWEGGLLPAAPFRGDVYIAPLRWKKIPLIKEELVREIHRRQKYLIAGPLKTLDELHQAQSLGIDGYYVTEPSVLESLRSTNNTL